MVVGSRFSSDGGGYDQAFLYDIIVVYWQILRKQIPLFFVRQPYLVFVELCRILCKVSDSLDRIFRFLKEINSLNSSQITKKNKMSVNKALATFIVREQEVENILIVLGAYRERGATYEQFECKWTDYFIFYLKKKWVTLNLFHFFLVSVAFRFVFAREPNRQLFFILLQQEQIRAMQGPRYAVVLASYYSGPNQLIYMRDYL